MFVVGHTTIVNVETPYGFPFTLNVKLTSGYTLSGLSTGLLMIDSTVPTETAIINSYTYTGIDITNNQYVINVPEPDLSVLIAGKRYEWSFTADETLFRIQGSFRVIPRTGTPSNNIATDNTVDVNLGDVNLDISFNAETLTLNSGVTSVFGRTGDVTAKPNDYSVSDIDGLQSALDAKQDTIDIVDGGDY